MRLTQFPDINWLRDQAKNDFQNGRDVNNQPITQQGWPSVVLNTTSFGAERNGIKGPFSLFLNLKGNSIVKANGRSVALTTNNACLVNKGDFYDLIIPEGNRTDTFNIHFGENLYNEVVKEKCSITQNLLDDPFEQKNLVNAHTKSIWKSDCINERIGLLKQFYTSQLSHEDLEYELLAGTLSAVLDIQSEDSLSQHNLSVTKRSTKQELIQRISLSIDYIHAHFAESISLDKLSSIACLSKYHYLRSFKALYNCTPQQMISSYRFQKATDILSRTSHSISEVGIMVGFSELPAFTRFFTKNAGISPKRFRRVN
ncbi:AraC family transcriptional regulator [Roseivirga sp. E12]|uniref:helix-turn-helix domain-containing protein n=1 Tax=Roseivirga sp. E12 TaxID=2819237 RepID=UPI001ABD1AD4|nr:AraC family transcriptional regulator [Roseivirga sp. E12]MBO3697530.1 helix-turn-helix transcriptional regulator [Roseivirga sp. E12]